MWPFGKHKKGSSETEEKILVIDVGSSRIASAIVLLKPHSKPTILSISRHEIQTGDFFDMSRYKHGIRKGIVRCIDSLKNDHRTKRYSKVIVTISPLIHKVNLRTIKVSGLDKQKISESYINKLVENNTQSITEDSANPVIIMDKEIMSISLNGYRTENYLGNETNSIVIKLFVSLIDASIFNLIVESVTDCTHLERNQVSLHSYEYSAWSALSTISAHKNYIYAEFGGEITEIIDIEHGVINKQTSLPVGKKVLIREHSKLNQKPHGITDSELKMHYGNKLNANSTDLMIMGLEEQATTLYRDTHKSDEDMDYVHKIIIMIGGDELVRFMYNVFERLGFAKNNIHILDKNILNKYCKHSGGNITDTFLMLSVIFSAKIQSKIWLKK